MRKTILPILLAFCGLAASQFAAANENILRREHAQQMNRIGHCMQVYGNATCTDYSPSSSSYRSSSYDSPSVSSSYTPPSPEELARINNWLRLHETRTPKHCTPVADRMQRCWEGNYHPMPADSKHPAIRPLVKLYTLDDKGNIQGHELEYSRQTAMDDLLSGRPTQPQRLGRIQLLRRARRPSRHYQNKRLRRMVGQATDNGNCRVPSARPERTRPEKHEPARYDAPRRLQTAPQSGTANPAVGG